MKTSISLLIALSFGIIACGQENTLGPQEPAAKLTVSQNKAGGPRTTHSPMLTFAALEETGASKLVRHAKGAMMSLRAGGTGFSPGDAVSVWWVVFNEPGGCATVPCSEADLFAPGNPAQVDILGSGGQVVDGQGNLNIKGRLKQGDSSTSAMPFFKAALDLGTGIPIGMLVPSTAEIHLVLRNHGPVIDGQLDAQLNTFEGGCSNFLQPPALVQQVGDCVDTQFSIHQP